MENPVDPKTPNEEVSAESSTTLGTMAWRGPISKYSSEGIHGFVVYVSDSKIIELLKSNQHIGLITGPLADNSYVVSLHPAYSPTWAEYKTNWAAVLQAVVAEGYRVQELEFYNPRERELVESFKRYHVESEERKAQASKWDKILRWLFDSRS